MRSGLLLAVAAAASLLFAGQAAAQVITPNTAVASSEFSAGFDGLAVNTINGSGLPGGFDLDAAHAAYASGNHWTTATGTSPTTQSIVWGFATPQTLVSIYIWNHQSTVPPASNAGYDVTLFDLTLRDPSNNVLLALNDVSLLSDTATAQAFSFGGSFGNVSSVLFEVRAVQSSPNFTGLAEVRFDATPVPEPSSVLLVCAASAGLIAWDRRRRSRCCT